MNAGTVSLINALLLIGLGGYGYLGSDNPSTTALIPVAFGVALLFCNPGVRKENKVVAHIAVLLTLVALLGLGMALKGAIGRENSGAIIRVSIMIASTVLAMVFFVRSFIAARKAREAGQ